MKYLYLYRVVDGAGVFGSPKSIKAAKASLRESCKRISLITATAELERVLQIGNRGHRYWRWRNRKWSTKCWTDPTPEDLSRWRTERGKHED